MSSSCDRGPVDLEAPAAPCSLKVENLVANSARLVWEAVDGARGYNLSVNGAAPVEVTEVFYEAIGLTPETAYTWRVQAVKGDAKSPWAEGPAFTTPKEGEQSTPPPTDLLAVDITHQAATLTWKHTDADRHEMVIGDAETVTTNGTGSYSLTGLTPETIYAWRVRSAKGDRWSEWVDGPEFTTKAFAALPSELSATDVTHDSAILSWVHADGDTHEVAIGDAAPVAVGTPGYKAEGLAPETPYTWKVRSGRGGEWSEWVEGPAFTTLSVPIQIEFLYNVACGYGLYPGKSQIKLGFTTFDTSGGDKSGWYMELGIVAAAFDEPRDRPWQDIPAGTYTFSDSGAVNTVFPGTTFMFEVASDGTVVEPRPKITSGGAMTISGDHNEYTIAVDFTLNDKRRVVCSYKGGIKLKNNGFIPGLLADFVRADFLEGKPFYSFATNYYLRMYDDGAATGNIFMLTMDMYAPKNSAPGTIPDGTYTFDKNSVNPFQIYNGSLMQKREGQQYDLYDKIVSGTCTVAGTGEGTCTITVDFVMNSVTHGDYNLKRTYTGAVTPVAR